MSGTVPERGTIPQTHPALAMAMPVAGRKSGILTLRRAKVRHDIAFVEGRATAVDSNAAKESLPVLLAAKGRLTQQQSAEVLAGLRAKGTTADQLLVERGLVPPEQIEELMRWRAALLVVKTTTWPEGEYSFRAMSHPRLAGPELTLQMPSLLLQAVLRLRSSDALFLSVRRALDRPVRWAEATTDRDSYVLEQGDHALLDAITGATTLGEALSASRLPGGRAQALAWTMLACGAVVADEPGSVAPPPEPPEPPPPAARPTPTAVAEEEESLELELDDSGPAEPPATPVDSGPRPAIATPVDTGPAPAAESPPPADDEAARKARMAALEASLFGADAKPLQQKVRPATWGSAEGAAIPVGGGPAAGDAEPEDPADDGPLAELRQLYKRLRRQDHFEVLGVPRDADGGAIRKAYFQLAKTYHPDRYSGQSDKAYQFAESIFAIIGEAHEVLSNESRRTDYLHKLEHGDDDAETEQAALAKVQQILDAERAFKTGLRVLQVGRIPDAHEHFRQAYEGYDEEPEYQCYYGYTSYRMKQKSDPLGARGGIDLLESVLASNPEHGVALHLLGKIAMLEGDHEEAVKRLRRARRVRPGDEDIKRDLRRAEHEALRSKKGEGLGSVLGGLFSRKK